MKFKRTETKNPLTNQRVIVIGSLIDWKMRSSQKIAWLYGIYPRAMNYSFFIHKISKCF